MRQRLFSYVLAFFAILSLFGCASRNEVCETCLERTDERMMDASAGLYPDAVKRLIDEGADINIQDQYGETPLMKALRQPASHSLESMRPLEETIVVLLDAGADIDITNKRGVDTTTLAVATGNLAVVKLFNEHLSQTQRDDMFMQALLLSQYEIALYLLEAGANPAQVNERNQSALHLSVNNPQPNVELVKILLKANNINLLDDYQTSAVMTACANAAPVEVVKLLFENGANKNSRFQNKNLLYLALTAENEKTDLVRYLLQNGFSPNEVAPNGMPFLLLMAKADRFHSAKALADAGADISVLDKYGQQAYRARLNILGV